MNRRITIVLSVESTESLEDDQDVVSGYKTVEDLAGLLEAFNQPAVASITVETSR